MTCVYVNPELDRFSVIDYRIYDPRGDGKTKLEHVQEMLSVFVESRALAFSTVLMDSWYATKSVLLHIESLGKQYYCPLKSNQCCISPILMFFQNSVKDFCVSPNYNAACCRSSGLAKAVSGSPSKITCPSRSKRTRSAYFKVRSVSWVAKMRVLCSRRISSQSSSIN